MRARRPREVGLKTDALEVVSASHGWCGSDGPSSAASDSDWNAASDSDWNAVPECERERASLDTVCASQSCSSTSSDDARDWPEPRDLNSFVGWGDVVMRTAGDGLRLARAHLLPAAQRLG